MNTAALPSRAPRPLTIEEVADVYARPVSFVTSWIESGRLPAMRLTPRTIRVAWKDVVEQYCGVPAVDLAHPDTYKEERERNIREREALKTPEGRAEFHARQVVRNVVYFVEAKSVGLVKIGVADDPRARFRSLVTMSPVPLMLRALRPGDRQTESETHRRFAEERSHGEWFKITSRIQREMRSHFRTYGLPEWANP